MQALLYRFEHLRSSIEWLLTVSSSCQGDSSLSELHSLHLAKRPATPKTETSLCCSLCLPATRRLTQSWSRMTERWRHKTTTGGRRLAPFIETALVPEACNSSGALVLMAGWQSFHSQKQGEVKDGLGRSAGTKEDHCLTQGHFSNQANHTWNPSERTGSEQPITLGPS